MDKKIIKEWNKIKDFSIFDNIEEFAKLFKEKPYGKCLRKYPTYPWCNENFFFGDIEELNSWYKTTDEVPFYCTKFIGQKYGKLTILSFFQNHSSKNKRSLFVNCECECGNIIQNEFHAIQHGDIISCGCAKRKVQSLLEYNKDIVDKYWNYEKNIETPNKVAYNSSNKYWWKGYNNYNYQMAPIELLEKGAGTSFPEQTVFYYVRKKFPDAINRYKVLYNNKKVEVDIFIPSLNVGIEYDGVAWHNTKADDDKLKSNILSKTGIYLIRIQEPGLNPIKSENGITIQCKLNDLPYYKALSQCVNQVLDELCNIVQTQKEITVSEKDIINTKPMIYNNYIIGFKEDCIANSWLIKFWSNKNLIAPYKVSESSCDRFVFTCKKGYDLLISPKALLNIDNQLSYNQQEQFHEEFLCEGYNNHKYRTEVFCPFYNLPNCPCNKLYNDDGEKRTCMYFYRYMKKSIANTSFGESSHNLNNSIKNIVEDRDNQIAEIKSNLLKVLAYDNPKVEEVLVDFINSKDITDVDKKNIVQDIFSYGSLHINKIFTYFKKYPFMFDFYLNSIDYNVVLSEKEDIILNLNHEYQIFEIIKYSLLKNKINIFIKWIESASKFITKEDSDRLLCSALIQLQTKNRESVINFIKDKIFIKKLLSYLNEFFPNGNSIEIVNEFLYVENDQQKILQYIQNSQTKLFSNYIIDKSLSETEFKKDLLTIEHRIQDYDLYLKIIMNVINYFNNSLPKSLAETLHKNIYFDNQSLSVYDAQIQILTNNNVEFITLNEYFLNHGYMYMKRKK